jgi:hypothetical protein
MGSPARTSFARFEARTAPNTARLRAKTSMATYDASKRFVQNVHTSRPDSFDGGPEA